MFAKDAGHRAIDRRFRAKARGERNRCPVPKARPRAFLFPVEKVENHMWALALHSMHYNFCRIHKTLRVTPAMEAGIADHVWSVEEITALLDRSDTIAA